MNFIEKMLTAIGNGFTFIGDMINGLMEFLAQVLGYILEFFIGIFYFIAQMFLVLIEFIKLFGAFFQFLFAIVQGLFRTISTWIGFTPDTSYNMPSTSREGFNAVLDQLGGTGLFNVIPYILIALIWIFFVYKIIGLIGSKGANAN